MVTKFPIMDVSLFSLLCFLLNSDESAYLGFSRCVTVNNTPSKMHMPPTTTYAMPKKGLRPPMTVRVLMTTDLVPLYTEAGNPDSNGQLKDVIWNCAHVMAYNS